MTSAASEFDIAIIGAACRLPGANTLDGYWDNLVNGVNSIQQFSLEELLEAGVPLHELESELYVKAAPIIENSGRFDARFFGYTPKDAELMDPQQRHILELSWQAFEDASVIPGDKQERTAVYAGSAFNSYVLSTGLKENYYQDWLPTLLGADKDFQATRVAFKLGLTGPAISVQTACSTSLVAVHMACQALISQEIDQALVAAASVRCPVTRGYMYEPGGVMSPDGICRPFDATASGTVFGSGAGAVLLKRLSDAIADGDPIRAVIKGSAINNDGASKSDFTAPTIDSQAQVITEALGSADLAADEISYVEAHGTGTSIGDPIEVAALTKAFRQDTQENQFCHIGSVKANIGHLDAAAGMASLLKVVLALQNKTLPACLNYRAPNPQIDFPTTPFQVVEKTEPWAATADSLRTAGITSLGMGGTNAHLIVQEYSATPEVPSETSKFPASVTSSEESTLAGSEKTNALTLLPLSAKDDSALTIRAEQLANHLSRHQDQISLSDLIKTLNEGRMTMSRRQVTVIDGMESASDRLLNDRKIYSVQTSLPIREREIIFMFPGQGSQLLGMGKTLYAQEQVFRDALNEVVAVVNRSIEHDLLEILFAETESPLAALINQTQYTQSCLFAVQYAYYALLTSWGIQPSAVIGHSIGEYVAAVVAGVMTVETGAKIVTERGRLMQSADPGAMTVVHIGLSSAEVDVPESLDIAVINAADSYVVAGEFDAIEQFETTLDENNVRFTRLKTSHAFHSRMMESVLPAFTDFVAKEALEKPVMPIISNVTGDWLTESDCLRPEYWASQLRNAVQFEKGLSTILNRGELIALECGAGNTLSSLFNQHNDKQSGQIALACAPLKRSPLTETEAARLTVGALWCNGQSIALPQTNKDSGRKIALPSYPFVGDHHWYKSSLATTDQSSINDTSVSGNKIRLKQNHWVQQTTWNWVPPTEHPSEIPKLNIVGIGCNADWVDDRVKRILSSECDYSDVVALETVPHLLVAWPEDDTEEVALQKMLGLFQALTKFDGVQDIYIDLLTRGASGCLGSEVNQISGSMASAVALVAQREWPHIKIHTNDVAWNANQEEWELLTQQLANSNRPTVTAIRNGHCWERASHPLKWEQETSDQLFTGKGSVVLVGGFGGIGQALGHWLADQNVPLILTHRPSDDGVLKADQAAWVESLQLAGSSVTTVALQPDDRASTEAFVDVLSQQDHPIEAVIYLAGSVDDALIPNQTVESLARVTTPKMHGVKTLIDAIDSAKIATKLVLFSSTAAWYGPVGQFNYAAANAYLMGLASAPRKDFCDVVSIAWPGWKDTGMLKSVRDPATLQVLKSEGISVKQGIENLVRCLSLGTRTAWVSPTALGFLPTDSQVDSQAPATLNEVAPTQDAPTGEHLESSSTEARITSHWQEMLGGQNLTSNQDYFDLGGTSLVALKLCARIERDLGVEFTVEDLMAAPTIAQQTQLISERLEEQGIADGASAVKSVEPPTSPMQPENNAATRQNVGLARDRAASVQQDKVKSLVPLRVNSEVASQTPVYLIHAHGGMVVGYQTLARVLGKYRPVYGLQAQGVRGGISPLNTIEAMAERYAAEIIADSDGPYIIGGYCMGGTIAWEVAEKIQSLGGEVKLIMMIQSFHRELNYPIVQNGKTLYPEGTAAYYRLSLVKDKLVEVISRNLNQSGVSLQTVAGILKGAMARFKRTVANKTGKTSAPTKTIDLNASDDSALLAVHSANGEAFMSYSPSNTNIPVAFYSAEHQPAHIRDDYTLGYRSLASGWTSIRPTRGSFLQGLDSLDFEQITENLESDLKTI